MLTKKSISDSAIFGVRPSYDQQLHVGRPISVTKIASSKRMAEVFDRRWLANPSLCVEEFEHCLRQLLGVRHCDSMCNAIVGLQLAMRAMEMSGEVIVHFHRHRSRRPVARLYYRVLRHRPSYPHNRSRSGRGDHQAPHDPNFGRSPLGTALRHRGARGHCSAVRPEIAVGCRARFQLFLARPHDRQLWRGRSVQFSRH